MAGSNFVDYVKIFARSGHGGGGSTHFRREKFVAFGGPDGGDGGKGGSIVLQGDSQYWTLIHLKYQRHQFAEDGQCGSGARSSGKDAKDIVIPVPLGTVAKRIVTQEDGTIGLRLRSPDSTGDLLLRALQLELDRISAQYPRNLKTVILPQT